MISIRVGLAQATSLGGPVFTCSMGIAATPRHGTGHEELLALADRALYRAKETGRDRAIVAGASEAEPDPETGEHPVLALPAEATAAPEFAPGGEPPKEAAADEEDEPALTPGDPV